MKKTIIIAIITLAGSAALVSGCGKAARLSSPSQNTKAGPQGESSEDVPLVPGDVGPITADTPPPPPAPAGPTPPRISALPPEDEMSPPSPATHAVVTGDGVDDTLPEIGTPPPPTPMVGASTMRATWTPAPKTGMINVLFRGLDSHTGHWVLCRMKGPSGVKDWSTDLGRSKGYTPPRCYDRLGTIGDYEPVSVLDPNRRQIHVLADFDLGSDGAVGVYHFTCDARSTGSMACHKDSNSRRSDGGYFPGQLHFQPAPVFVKGQRHNHDGSYGDDDTNDRIVAFQHGGGDLLSGGSGKLKFYAINPTDDSITDLGWVGEHMTVRARRQCDSYANIDETPSVVVLTDIFGKKELHLFARTGGDNLMHLYLPAGEYQKFASKEDYLFRCERFNRGGLTTSPTVIARPDDKLQIVGGGSSNPYLWSGYVSPDPDSLAPVGRDCIRGDDFCFEESITKSIAPEAIPGAIAMTSFETMTVAVNPDDPAGDVDAFYRINHNQLAHVRISGNGETVSTSYYIGLLDAPAAVKDGEGNLHIFGADVVESSSGSSAKMEHIFLQPGFAPYVEMMDGDIDSVRVENNEGHGRSGVTAVYVPNN